MKKTSLGKILWAAGISIVGAGDPGGEFDQKDLLRMARKIEAMETPPCRIGRLARAWGEIYADYVNCLGNQVQVDKGEDASTPSDAEVVVVLRGVVDALRANRLSLPPGAFEVFHGDALLDVLDALLSGRRPAGMSPEQRDKFNEQRPHSVSYVTCGIGWSEEGE